MIADPDTDLGIRLKSLWNKADLSQRALAKKVGIPHSTISLIESGQNNPTVAGLRRIWRDPDKSAGVLLHDTREGAHSSTLGRN